MKAETFAIFIAIAIFVFVVDLIRRQKMSFKYSMFWLGSSLAVMFFAVYHQLLAKIAHLLGFTLPSNFIFFLMLVFFILLSLLLTIYVNEQNSRSEALAQTIAMLEYKMNRLESKQDKK